MARPERRESKTPQGSGREKSREAAERKKEGGRTRAKKEKGEAGETQKRRERTKGSTNTGRKQRKKEGGRCPRLCPVMINRVHTPDLTLCRTIRGAIIARTRRGTGEEHRNGGEGRERRGGEQSHQEGGRATREREQKPRGRQHGGARKKGSTGGSLACISNRAHIQGRSALKGDGCEYQVLVLTDQMQGGKKGKQGEEEKRTREPEGRSAERGTPTRPRQTDRQTTDKGGRGRGGSARRRRRTGERGRKGKGGRQTDRRPAAQRREGREDREECMRSQ